MKVPVHIAVANANEARRIEREADLRDSFARAALEGLARMGGIPGFTHAPAPASLISARAYELADAMMAARGAK